MPSPLALSLLNLYNGSDHFARDVIYMETDTVHWPSLTQTEKKAQLFIKQKRLLDTFLQNGAISRAQYDKSLHDLREKMGIDKSMEREEI